MSSVVRLSRYRSVAHRDIPLELPAGDSDLRFIAAAVWFASLIRVSFALAHREVFGAEATLALFALVLLPMLAIRSRH
jgi:hypothetical protein